MKRAFQAKPIKCDTAKVRHYFPEITDFSNQKLNLLTLEA